MKKLLLISLMVVIASASILCGCSGPSTELESSVAELESRVAELEKKDASLLIVLNAPLEWGGRVRIGNFYNAFALLKSAALSEEFDSVAMYYGPESTDYTAVGELEAMGAPMFPEGENLAEVSRYLQDELGVKFYGPIDAIEHHEITPQDFIKPINWDETVDLFVNAGKIVGF